MSIVSTRVGVLTRREIEARILAPVIDALGQRFGRDEVVDRRARRDRDSSRASRAARWPRRGRTIRCRLCRHAGTVDAATMRCELEVREQTNERLSFDVTRCRYAEMYRALGIPELGAVLSCNRDAALIEGFNATVTLVRTQTIMQGAPCCDFRYTRAEGQHEEHENHQINHEIKRSSD